jgi:hypothetical protein
LVTHGDAGLVFSPGGDYVIVEYLSLPAGDTGDWLSYDITFPILREISRTTFNYFNPTNPNLEDPQARSDREAAAREAAAEAAENGDAAEEEVVGTRTPVPTPSGGE